MLFIVVSILVAVGRFFIPGHDLSWAGTYEAFAHIWVGMLLAVIIEDKLKGKRILRSDPFICLVLITLLEVVMFLLRSKP